ncbi:murein biosynthesis integral membrane protein MurJ [Alkalicaulis satelles]|uniref:Probable lipid II flippase MurJ n=1 Tax=Alkalicaulis satelles TaxID=2609175 RepID=A0A5M6ZJH3_9PROT|nr:murein biosynthesis integral membrane protein MurJ [Alkalicaulis satelles]KAA5803398.1 murein biosynthesis integral membrane protein MurJ [Alkalicaulis satelles]
MRLLRNLGVVSAFTFASRILGLVRESLMAGRLGAGPVADVFFQALVIPNTFRRVLAEGAFNAAFVPLYARELEGKGQAEADAFASEALSVLASVTLLIVVAIQVLAPWIGYAFFPGQIDDPGLFTLAVLLLQIMMPYTLCMVVTALIGGGLNSHGRFATAAGAPMLFNLALIVVLMFEFADRETLALWLAIGVTASGVMQVALLALAARRAKLKFTLRAPRLTPRVKRLIALGIPGAVAAGVTQINVLVTSSIAMLEDGARSYLYYSERLYQLPLGVIGIAMGLALLPNLARRLRSGDEAGGNFAMNRSIEISLALTLPAVAAMLVIPQFLVGGLFEWGAFTAEHTANTAMVLIAYGTGLPAFILIKVLTPGFFAREDTATPMRYALISVGVNFFLAVTLFFGGVGFVGLAIATSVAGWINVLMLTRTLLARKLWRLDARLAARLPRQVLAAAMMAAAVWVLAGPGADWITGLAPSLGRYPGQLIVLGAVVALGAVIYGLAALALGALTREDLRDLVRRKPDRD